MSKKWKTGHNMPSCKGFFEIRYLNKDGSQSLLSNDITSFLWKRWGNDHYNKKEMRDFFQWRGPIRKLPNSHPMYSKFQTEIKMNKGFYLWLLESGY